jgi:hypothetical protein
MGLTCDPASGCGAVVAKAGAMVGDACRNGEAGKRLSAPHLVRPIRLRAGRRGSVPQPSGGDICQRIVPTRICRCS